MSSITQTWYFRDQCLRQLFCVDNSLVHNICDVLSLTEYDDFSVRYWFYLERFCICIYRVIFTSGQRFSLEKLEKTLNGIHELVDENDIETRQRTCKHRAFIYMPQERYQASAQELLASLRLTPEKDEVNSVYAWLNERNR